jgi:hypothetical protein
MRRDDLDPALEALALLDAGATPEASLALLDALADAAPPLAPSAVARARLLAALDGPERLAPLVPRIARWSDLAADAVRAVLARLHDPAAWTPGPLPGVELLHFEHGPLAAGLDTGFVRFAPGTRFPRHRHAALEVNLVVEGALHDDDGRVYGPGEALERGPGTEHAFATAPDVPTVVFVAQSGFEIVGPHPDDAAPDGGGP